MDRLAAMGMFVAVVEQGSFSRAARRLRVGNSTVTEGIARLEAYLGMRLLNRTTRQVSPTWEGGQYYARAKQILQEIDDAELAIGEMRSTPRGRLVIEVPAALGRTYIVPALPRFTEMYPLLEVHVLLNPRPLPLEVGNIDVSVQLGELPDSNFIAKKIYETHHVACASPAFLAAHGEPKHPKDLTRFNCLAFFSPISGAALQWKFEQGKEAHRLDPVGNIKTNSSEALIDCAMRGAGIVYLPDILVRPAIGNGSLKPLLRDWNTLRRPIYLVRLHKRHASAKVRSFNRFIEDVFSALPPASALY